MNDYCSKPLCYFYVTGHGFGHATRSLGLVEHLITSGFRVVIITSLNENFFFENLSIELVDIHSYLKVENRCLDAGAIQYDPLKMEIIETLRNYFNTVHSKYDSLLEREIECLKTDRPDIVLTDATPLGCTAAKACGIKSLIVSNFTWDKIYKLMLESYLLSNTLDEIELKNFNEMIKKCEDDYSSSNYYFQLPGIMDVPTGYKGEVISSPLVSRKVKRSRGEIREHFNIPHDSYVAVLGFGGQPKKHGAFNDEMLPNNWVCLVLQSEGMVFPSKRFIPVPRNVYIPDILNASEVMLGKLGYGTVSECLSTKTPLVFVPREDWPEEPPLQSLMEKYDSAVLMPKSEYDTGNWSSYLLSALEKKKNSWDIDDLRPISAFDEIVEKIKHIIQ
jgi:L-arabinokinase